MSTSHHETTTHAHPELSFVRKYIFSEDHKIIGIQFLVLDADLSGHRRHAGPAGPHPARLAARGVADPQGPVPDQQRRPDVARVLQHALQHARHGDDLLCHHPDPGGELRQLT